MASSASPTQDRPRSFRCSDDLWERLERVCEEQDRSLSSALRLAIERYVREASTPQAQEGTP